MKDRFTRRVILICVLLCAAALLGSIWSIKNSYSNKARVDNAIALYKSSSMNAVTRDSLLRELQMMKVKEDYFINQIGIQSDWFIAYVSILFVIFGFIGFSVFDGQIKQIRADNEVFRSDQYTKNAEMSTYLSDLKQDLEQKHNDLRLDLYREESYSSGHLAIHAENIGAYSAYILNLLESVKSTLKGYDLLKDEAKKDKAIKFVIEDLISVRAGIKRYGAAPKSKTELIENFDHDYISEILDEVIKKGNKEIIDLAVEIRMASKQINKEQSKNKSA